MLAEDGIILKKPQLSTYRLEALEDSGAVDIENQNALTRVYIP